MNKPNDLLSHVDADDIDCNDSPNEHFNTVLNARLSRRSLLRGSFASAATAVLGATGLSACGSDSGPVEPVAPVTPVTPPPPPNSMSNINQ